MNEDFRTNLRSSFQCVGSRSVKNLQGYTIVIVFVIHDIKIGNCGLLVELGEFEQNASKSVIIP